MTTTSRRGERLGWSFGWFGGFVWLLVVAILQWLEDRTLQAVIGLAIAAAAVIAIVGLAPWRHPQSTYRSLLLPIYVLFFGAVTWAVWALGGPRALGINSWWSAFLLLPLMLPVFLLGNRRWEDGER